MLFLVVQARGFAAYNENKNQGKMYMLYAL